MIAYQGFHVFLGYLAALASACAWALGSILFRKIGNEATPLGMNLCKGLVGILYLSIVIIVIGFKPMTLSTALMLAASGILGIALGDTLFFKTLMCLGPRLTVLLETMGPVCTVILAVVFLRERLSVVTWSGICLTIAGVTWVLWEESKPQHIHRKWRDGIVYALLSALCMALGIIFAKKVIETTSALQATLIRFIGATTGMMAWGMVTGSLKKILEPFCRPRLLIFTFFTVLVIIFGGFWLFLVALKYIDASIATVLNATAPLFILPLSAIFLKEKISSRAIVGAIATVCGVVLIFLA